MSTCARCARYSELPLTSLGGSVPSAAFAAASAARRAAGERLLGARSRGPASAPCSASADVRAAVHLRGGDRDGRPVLRAADVLRRTRRRPTFGTRISFSTSCGPSAVSNGPVKKSVAGDRALAVRPLRDEVGVEGEEDRAEVGGRVAVRDRAADRPAVADLRVADLAGASRETRPQPCASTGSSARSAWRESAPIAIRSPSSRT